MLKSSLEKLVALIDESGGLPISLPSGVQRAFRRTRLLRSADIDEIQRSIGLQLPEEYSLLLTTVGVATCFVDERGWASVEIYDPNDVERLYSDFFANADDLRRFFPIACNHQLQDLVVLVVGRPSPSNILIVPHDVPPEDWDDILDEGPLTSIEAWLGEALAADGALHPH